jgi:hypothetical protein
MATLTSKLQLRKPEGPDLVNVLTDLAQNYDKIDTAITRPPAAKVWRNTQLATRSTSGTTLAIPHNTVDYDESLTPMWASGQPTRFTVPTGYAGRYSVKGGFYFELTSNTGYRILYLYKNGLPIVETAVYPPANGIGVLNVAGDINAAAGDYFELVILQNSTVALGLSDVGQMYSCWFSAHLVARS